MTWDFTPAQVMKGEAEYTLEDFQRDLREKIKVNFGDKWDEAMLGRCYEFFWAFIHLSAIAKTPKDIGEMLQCPELMELMEKTCRDEIKMLMAIYQNLFLKFYPEALRDSWGDDKKATNRALAQVNLYISKHIKL